MELAYRTAGPADHPHPVLLVHGGAEDADLLTAQATAIAATGRRVIWYDRRGTGASTRADWPGDGAGQHADDAAALLRELGAPPATVLGFSSGGIVALALAVRHPAVVAEAIAWEAPVVTALPGGTALHESIMAPVREHLAGRPGDWTGAFRVMLGVLSDGRADPDTPEALRMARNAEAIVRDDGPLITRWAGPGRELAAAPVTIAVGEHPDDLHAAIAARLAEFTGRPVERVAGATDHEVYLARPEVFAAWLERRPVR